MDFDRPGRSFPRQTLILHRLGSYLVLYCQCKDGVALSVLLSLNCRHAVVPLDVYCGVVAVWCSRNPFHAIHGEAWAQIQEMHTYISPTVYLDEETLFIHVQPPACIVRGYVSGQSCQNSVRAVQHCNGDPPKSGAQPDDSPACTFVPGIGTCNGT